MGKPHKLPACSFMTILVTIYNLKTNEHSNTAHHPACGNSRTVWVVFQNYLSNRYSSLHIYLWRGFHRHMASDIPKPLLKRHGLQSNRSRLYIHSARRHCTEHLTAHVLQLFFPKIRAYPVPPYVFLYKFLIRCQNNIT